MKTNPFFIGLSIIFSLTGFAQLSPNFNSSYGTQEVTKKQNDALKNESLVESSAYLDEKTHSFLTTMKFPITDINPYMAANFRDQCADSAAVILKRKDELFKLRNIDKVKYKTELEKKDYKKIMSDEKITNLGVKNVEKFATASNEEFNTKANEFDNQANEGFSTDCR